MEASIISVRWKWKAYLDLLGAIDRLVILTGSGSIVSLKTREELEGEIASLDDLMLQGYTHFKPIKKGE